MRSRREHSASSRRHELVSKGGLVDALKSFGAVLATLSGMGAYYGFGTAQAMASTFGMGSGVWYESVLDLIAWAGMGVMGQYLALTKMPASEILLTSAVWSGVAAAVVALNWALLLVYQRARATIDNFPSILTRWVGVHELHKVPTETWPQIAKRVFGSVVASAIAGGSFFLLLLLGLILGLTLFFVIPLLGYSGGKAYARLAVLDPKRCLALPGAVHAAVVAGQYRSTGETGAACAELVSLSGQVMARGRVVMARSSFVIFYRPKEGDAILLSIKDAVLRPVDSLD